MKEKSEKCNRTDVKEEEKNGIWARNLNTFGFVLREYSRARKAIAFNCESE